MRRGGGRMQLVYIGKEDNFLTGNPSVSFFRFIYRRHTNFALESIRMYFQGKPDFGQQFQCTIPRFGDLLGPCFLIIDLPAIKLSNGQSVGYTNSIGNAIIDEMKIMIGETEIDKHDGIWEYIWNNITLSADKKLGYQTMVGQFDGNPTFTIIGPYRLHIPLSFWFNKNPGQYLPLLALQYHQIQIIIKLRSLNDMVFASGIDCNPTGLHVVPVSLPNVELWGDFVFLDNDERRRLVSKPLEYLIEQVQVIPPYSIQNNKAQSGMDLVINNPIKEIFWVFRLDAMEATHEWFNFTSRPANAIGGLYDLMDAGMIQLDGKDRFDTRDAKYFRLVQSYQRHTTIPNNLYIYMYSFALRPEQIQPSGTLNASRFESIILQVTTHTCPDPLKPIPTPNIMKCFAYALNYNILRIIEGYGGILFAN